MLKNFKTYHLAAEFYRLSRTIKLPAHLRDQLDRAASSVVLNLAEGAARGPGKDQTRIYRIAFGSMKESQAILSLAATSSDALSESADKVAAHLFKLIKAG